MLFDDEELLLSRDSAENGEDFISCLRRVGELPVEGEDTLPVNPSGCDIDEDDINPSRFMLLLSPIRLMLEAEECG